MCMPGHPPSDRPWSSPSKSLLWWSYLIQCHITFATKKHKRKSQYQFRVSTFLQHKKDLFQTADACCTIYGIPNPSKFFNSEELSCYEIAQWRRTQVQGLSLAVSRLTVPWLKKYMLRIKKKNGTKIFTFGLQMCLYRDKTTTTL